MALRAEHARKLLAAEQEWTRAKVALETAVRNREKERNRCRPGLELGKRIRSGGVEILITPTSTGQSFRLKDYLYKHKLTKAMREFVTEAREYDRWTVKQIAAGRKDTE